MRWFKTIRGALVFFVFYVGGAVFGLVVLPIVSLFTRDETTRIKRNQRIVTGGFRWTLAALRWTRIFDFDPRQVQPGLPDHPVLVVANHPTTIDVVAVLSVYRDAVVVIKDKIWNDRLLRWLFRWLGHVHGGDGTLESNLAVVSGVEERLSQGFHVVIFPEGTRSPAGGLAPMAKGAFAIAARTGVDILPVLITSDPPVLHRDAPWHELPDRPVAYRVRPLAIVPSRGLSTRQIQRRVVSTFADELGLPADAVLESL